MMLPGLKTALQPISQPSPSNAPNLRKPVSNGCAVHLHRDVAGKQFEIGDFDARAQMGLVAEDGIAHVIEMRRLGVVEEEGIFDLGGIADHAIVADDDVFADVGVVANLAILPDDGRPFDHDAVLQHRAFADENLFADEGRALAAVAQIRAQMGGQIGGDFRQRFPGILAAVEDCAMRGLGQVKQFTRLEHAAGRLRRGAWPAKFKSADGRIPDRQNPPFAALPGLNYEREFNVHFMFL